jgi:hypothetical protein
VVCSGAMASDFHAARDAAGIDQMLLTGPFRTEQMIPAAHSEARGSPESGTSRAGFGYVAISMAPALRARRSAR